MSNRTLGLIDGILGFLGILRGLALAVLCSIGLVRLIGNPAGAQGRLFFVLSILDGALLGLVAGGLLLAAGVLLMRNRRAGRIIAWIYAGMRLLFGFLSLLLFIWFLWRVRGQLVALALVGRSVVALGWATFILVSLGCFFGFFAAVAQFFASAPPAESWAEAERPAYPATPPSTIMAAGSTSTKTQVYRSPSRTVTLHVYQNGRKKEMKSFELYDADRLPRKILIGRAADCDIALTNDPAVSAHHCSMQCDENGQLCLVDLGSSNGTLLKRGIADPQLVTAKTPLRDQDIILLGERGVSQVRVLFDASLTRPPISW